MSDERITKVPSPNSSRNVMTAAAPRPNGEGVRDSVLLVGSPKPVWLLGRVICTVTVAAAFVILCCLLGGSVYPEGRMLSGPLWGFNLASVGHARLADAGCAIVLTALLLPCIFAVGVWRNTATITLCVLGCLAWLAIGFLCDVIASV
jgi:hypothetical protein